MSDQSSYEQQRALREQEKHQQSSHDRMHYRSKKWMWWGLGVLIVAGLVWWGVSASGDADVATVLNPHSIQSNDWVKGNRDAKVTLVEYSDFQCPACKAYFPLVQELSGEFPDDLRIVYRHFPLTSIHANALPAAQASEAAGAQGKFWEYHDLLFEKQEEWSGIRRPTSTFVGYAEQLGLDVERFEEDLDDSTFGKKVSRDRAAGNQLQLNGTPSFFLDGMRVKNPRSIEEFIEIVKAEVERVTE